MISIVIPVFNEAAAIRQDLQVIASTIEAYGEPHEIIVVNDGSTDETASVLNQIAGITVIEHPYNLGTGAALKTWIRAAQGEVIVMTDGDGTYPNSDIPKLLQYLGPYDMVIGARRTEQGTLKLLRVPAKALIRWLASYLTKTRIPDLNSGMRAFRRDLAQSYFRILPSGHSWVSTITMAFLAEGHKVRFEPIDYYPRKGRSSFHPIRDTYNYLMLVIRATMYFDPLKVFLPMSLFLLGLGFVKYLRDIFTYSNLFYFPSSTVVILMMGLQCFAIGLLADLIVKRGGPIGPRESNAPEAPPAAGEPKRPA